MPHAHLQFFSELPAFARVGGYFFCHAGVRPGVPLARQSAQDLLWIRGEFLDNDSDFKLTEAMPDTGTLVMQENNERQEALSLGSAERKRQTP